MIACCFVCKLPVQPATTFQEIHVFNLDFNSHDEIQNMNNICRDPCWCHSTYITKEWIVAPWHHREKSCLLVQLRNVSWKNIVIIGMFVYMFCRNFVWIATTLYYLFMSFLEANQNPPYMESSMMFFSNEELKDTGIVWVCLLYTSDAADE